VSGLPIFLVLKNEERLLLVDDGNGLLLVDDKKIASKSVTTDSLSCAASERQFFAVWSFIFRNNISIYFVSDLNIRKFSKSFLGN